MKKIVKDFLFESVERNGVMGIGTYSIGSSIMDYFLEQRGLIEIGLMNAIEDSIETDKEVSSREKPDMVFDEYSRRIEFVGKGINDGLEDGSGGKKHGVHNKGFVFKGKEEGERGNSGITKSFDFNLNNWKANIHKQHVFINTLR
jgi:hypothetical protein